MRRARELFLFVASIVVTAGAAFAQSVHADERSTLPPPFTVNPNMTQLADGGLYGFYDGGINGGIYKVAMEGAVSTSTLVYEFRPGQGGPPDSSSNRSSNVVTGPDGWIYFAGKSISRFNPATNTVEDLHRLTPAGDDGQLQLVLGIDGHTLFGANESGRVFSYDITSMRFKDVSHPGDGELIGIEQMKNGSLLVMMQSGFDVHLYSVDANGVETAPAILETRARALRPARDVNGDVYVFSSLFGDQTLQRISNTCFCLEELRRWEYGTFNVYNMAVRNGTVYLNPDSILHRFDVATGRFERLSNDQTFNYRILPSGLMLMVGDPERVAAINLDTYVPYSAPLLMGALMDPDGRDARLRRQQ